MNTLAPNSLTPPAGHRSRVSRTSVRFGSMQISKSAVAQGGVLLPAQTRTDSVRVHFVEEGDLHYRDHGGQARSSISPIRSGDALIAADPAVVELMSRGRYLITSIAIPQSVLSDVGMQLPAVQRVPDGAALLEPVAAFVSRAALVADVDTTGFSRYYFERLLQEMVLSLLIETAGANRVPRPTETYSLAMALIATQHPDPSLTAQRIARELRMSLRQLERVFRERATTITREIRRARVAEAVAMLRDESYRALTVDEIGRYVGFSGGSSLARAMANDGEASPAHIRSSAGQNPALP